MADDLTRDEVLALYGRHVNRGIADQATAERLPMEAASAGAVVWDEEGMEYLDCGGYGVFLLGHRHPRVVAAVRAQLERHPVATRDFLSGPLAAAAAHLVRRAPDGLEYVHFAGGGAEAVETAIKIARAAGHRRVIAMERGFHRKTLGALSITHRALFQRPFRPLLPGVETVPFGDVTALAAALATPP